MRPETDLQAALVFGLSPTAIALSVGLRTWAAKTPDRRTAFGIGGACLALLGATWVESAVLVVLVVVRGTGEALRRPFPPPTAR